MAQEDNSLKWVQGNKIELALPMKIVYFTPSGKVTQDYEPPTGSTICVELQSNVNAFCYTPTIEDNVLHFTDNGELPVGVYTVTVHIDEPNGTSRRSKLNSVIEVFDDNEETLREFDDFPDWADGAVIEGNIFFNIIETTDPTAYRKPVGGIPATDMTEEVQGLLDKASEVDDCARITGYYETMGCGTATHIKGQTVTDNEFIYRKSQANVTGASQIENIKGHTIEWNQLLKNTFSTTTGVTRTIDNDGKVTLVATNLASQFDSISNFKTVLGHKYLLYIRSFERTNCSTIFNVGGNSTSPTSSVIVTATVTSNDRYFRFRFNAGDGLASGYFCIFDITLIYGAGNEPSSVAQFEDDYFRWFGKPLTYEAYDAGSLRSVKMAALKTTGFNQFNLNAARTKAIRWNQLIPITDNDRSVSASGITITDNRDGTVTVNGTNNTSSSVIFYVCPTKYSIAQGHKAIMYGSPSMVGWGNFTIYDGSVGGTTSVGNSGYKIYTMVNRYAINIAVWAGKTVDNVTFAPMIFDLTDIYGAGNEPTTGEEFEADYLAWTGHRLTYEQYATGGSTKNISVVDVKALKETYQITGGNTAITLNDVPIRPDANGLFTLTEYGTMEVSGGDGTTCLHFSDAEKNGTHEPYEEHIVNIPIASLKGRQLVNGVPIGESIVIYPNGELPSAGSAHDEIYYQGGKTYVAKTCKTVNLGNSTWSLQSNNVFYCSMYDMANRGKSSICSRYKKNGDVVWSNMPDKSIYAASGSSTSLWLRDSSYSTASDLKASLNGTLFCYKLTTPIIYELDNFKLPLNFYDNADGTEEVVQAQGATSYVAPILGIRYATAIDDVMGKKGIVSQTQTWTGSSSTGYSYTMSNLVYGYIPQANIDLFVSAGATFNASTGYFELNGLTDISYQEMQNIYNAPHLTVGTNFMPTICAGKTNVRTLFPSINTDISYSGLQAGTMARAFILSNIESIVFAIKPNGTLNDTIPFNACNHAFYSCKRLKSIEKLTLTPGAILNSMFALCYSLENIKLYRLVANVSFSDSALLQLESIVYMVTNAANTSAITITLHATAYARCQADTTSYTYSGNTYTGIIALATAKNITIASA